MGRCSGHIGQPGSERAWADAQSRDDRDEVRGASAGLVHLQLSKRCCNVRDEMWAVKAAATVAALALLLPVVLTDRNEERRPSMGGKSRRYLSCS